MQNHRKKNIIQHHTYVWIYTTKLFLPHPKVRNLTLSGHCPLQRRFVSTLGKTVIQKIPHGRVHLVPQVLIVTKHFVYQRTTLIWPLVQISLICVSFFVVHVQSRSVIQASLYLSASSKMMILCLPFGRVTFCWANILILFLTTSIPLWKK